VSGVGHAMASDAFEDPEHDVDDVDDELDDDALEDEDEDEDDIGNRVSSSSGALDDSAGNRRDGGVARAVLEYVAAALVEDPTGISVVPEARRGSVTFHLHVAPEDMGRVIGRRGRVAQALRTVVRVAGARDGVDAGVDIVD
jgi:predicted RNA-binding protein YlqC (UPF0109 family)